MEISKVHTCNIKLYIEYSVIFIMANTTLVLWNWENVEQDIKEAIVKWNASYQVVIK